MTGLSRKAGAIAAAALFTLRLGAQITTGEITGTVTDAGGAVIAGAAITATTTATNTQRTATSSGAGVYAVTTLPQGSYTLRVEMQGFKRRFAPASNCRWAQVQRFDMTLAVGNVSEVIEVQGGAPLIETDNTSLGDQDRQPADEAGVAAFVLTSSEVPRYHSGGCWMSSSTPIAGRRCAFPPWGLVPAPSSWWPRRGAFWR